MQGRFLHLESQGATRKVGQTIAGSFLPVKHSFPVVYMWLAVMQPLFLARAVLTTHAENHSGQLVKDPLQIDRNPWKGMLQ